MFNFDSFMRGEQCLSCGTNNLNRLFQYLKDKGVCWENGALVGSETLSVTEDGYYLVNENGVRRANSSGNPHTSGSYYVVINGKLHKKLYRYASNNGLPVYNINEIPNENEIDSEGYEKEVY